MPVALQNEGYSTDRNSGGNFVAGSKGIHTAVIVCSPAPDEKTLVQIVVASDRHGVKLEFSRPGKPTDNAFIESFNGRVRQECLQQHWSESLLEARRIVEDWR